MDKKTLTIVGIVIAVAVVVLLISGKFTGQVISGNKKIKLFIGKSSTFYLSGNAYKVSLDAVSDNSATIFLSDINTGKSDAKEINEGGSKTLLGLNVFVSYADENTAVPERSNAVILISEIKVTYEGVLEMLGKCKGVHWNDDISNMTEGNYNCNNICKIKSPGSICATGVIVWDVSNFPKVDFKSCDTVTSPVSVDLSCLCCSI